MNDFKQLLFLLLLSFSFLYPMRKEKKTILAHVDVHELSFVRAKREQNNNDYDYFSKLLSYKAECSARAKRKQELFCQVFNNRDLLREIINQSGSEYEKIKTINALRLVEKKFPEKLKSIENEAKGKILGIEKIPNDVTNIEKFLVTKIFEYNVDFLNSEIARERIINLRLYYQLLRKIPKKDRTLISLDHLFVWGTRAIGLTKLHKKCMKLTKRIKLKEGTTIIGDVMRETLDYHARFYEIVLLILEDNPEMIKNLELVPNHVLNSIRTKPGRVFLIMLANRDKATFNEIFDIIFKYFFSEIGFANVFYDFIRELVSSKGKINIDLKTWRRFCKINSKEEEDYRYRCSYTPCWFYKPLTDSEINTLTQLIEEKNTSALIKILRR